MKSVIGAARESMPGGKMVAHCVVEWSPGPRRVAGPTVVVCALTAMILR